MVLVCLYRLAEGFEGGLFGSSSVLLHFVFGFLLGFFDEAEHFEDLEAVFGGVAVEVVVEVAVESLHLLGGGFHLGDPGFKFFFGVSVVEPGSSAVAVPADVGCVGG